MVKLKVCFFALQAAIGALIIGYAFGYWKGQSKKRINFLIFFFLVIFMKFDMDYIAHHNRLTLMNSYYKIAIAIGLMIITLFFR